MPLNTYREPSADANPIDTRGAGSVPDVFSWLHFMLWKFRLYRSLKYTSDEPATAQWTCSLVSIHIFSYGWPDRPDLQANQYTVP